MNAPNSVASLAEARAQKEWRRVYQRAHLDNRVLDALLSPPLYNLRHIHAVIGQIIELRAREEESGESRS